MDLAPEAPSPEPDVPPDPKQDAPSEPPDPPPDDTRAPDARAETPPAERESATSADAAVPGDEAQPSVDIAPSEAQDEAKAEDAEDAGPADDAETREADDEGEAEAEAEDGKGKGKPKAKARPKKRKPRKKPPRQPEVTPLPPELAAEAAEAAVKRVAQSTRGGAKAVRAAIDLLQGGRSLAFVARFRRRHTGGMDERQLRGVLEGWHEARQLEEHRIRIRELLRKRGALSDEAAAALERAKSVFAMDDLAAPYLPVVAGRATVARGLGLQMLADGIRNATEAAPLSELAQPHVKEGGEPDSLDTALGGARDILAEELSLDAGMRGRLRELFHREAVVSVAARSERKPDEKPESGRHASLVGYKAPASKVPPLKFLDIRRAEKERAVVTTIEPPEEKAIEVVHAATVPDEHPHAGFLRAAAEDGYRRILKPLLQNEMRLVLKQKADRVVMEQFERNLRNLLLGPYAGPRRTLGLRPDVMKGHHWCAIDEQGLPTGAGQLPHEPTAGREACLTELKEVLRTYEVTAVAVGTTGGRADAVALAKEAAADRGEDFVVTEVPDGGTRTLEAMGPVEIEDRPVVPAEARGALSLARRFQDPLAELVRIDPKALALGPHLHDVHQGRLRTMLDQVVESCVAHAGVDPAKADVDLLARMPGFTRKAADAFTAWRNELGPLGSKAALAAVEGIGPEIAEQAVGFLRLPDAEDPRDRTQLHPEQYEVAEKMAAQVDVDLPTLFSDPEARKRVQLAELESDEVGPATLRYVLFQATAGQRDPRPRFTQPIPPPPEIKLETLKPGLVLQGRVLRAAPFGVFVDVSLGVEALIPVPHIGERPGIEPATVAPVGAVINARVLEVDLAKKRLTLSMRRDRPPPRGKGGPRGAGKRGPARGPREGGRPDRPPGRPEGRPAYAASGTGRGPGGPGRPRGGKGKGKGRGRKGGRFSGGGYSFGGGRRDRRDRHTPRTISLKPDEPEKPAEKVDESKMSPEELMQYKLDQLKKRLERPDD
jgi:uncharacterized protein